MCFFCVFYILAIPLTVNKDVGLYILRDIGSGDGNPPAVGSGAKPR